MKRSQFFLLCISFLFISSFMVGCIDIEQKLVLNEDGSGTLKVCYILDESLIKEILGETEVEGTPSSEFEIESFIDTTKVKLTYYNEKYEDDKQYIEMEYSFDDIDVLSESWTSDSNKITLIKEGSFFVFTWNFFNVDSDPKDSLVFTEYKHLFDDHFCEFSITVPGDIVEVNTGGEILEDKHNAYWKFSTLSYMRGDMLEIKAKILNWESEE
jgi:hypothetical protein